MRACPKTYIYERIGPHGGYAWIFKSQVYPLGQEKLVGRIKGVVGLPVMCSREIPEGTVQRFIKWHRRAAGV